MSVSHSNTKYQAPKGINIFKTPCISSSKFSLNSVLGVVSDYKCDMFGFFSDIVEAVSDFEDVQCRILLILMVVIITDSDGLGYHQFFARCLFLKLYGECGSFFVKSD